MEYQDRYSIYISINYLFVCKFKIKLKLKLLIYLGNTVLRLFIFYKKCIYKIYIILSLKGALKMFYSPFEFFIFAILDIILLPIIIPINLFSAFKIKRRNKEVLL